MADAATIAEGIIAKNRLTWTAPDGTPFRYRPLNVEHLVQRGILPPGILTGDVSAVEGITFDTPEEIAALFDAILCSALFEPAVWEGPEDARPKDQVLLADLGPYRHALVTAIVKDSGFTAEIIRRAAFRRRAAGAGRDARHGGNKARQVGERGDAPAAGRVGARVGRDPRRKGGKGGSSQPGHGAG